jgi:hypothetical protein
MPNDFGKQNPEQKSDETPDSQGRPQPKGISRTIWIFIFGAFGANLATIGSFLLNIHTQPIRVALTCFFLAAIFAALVLRLVLINHRNKHPMPYWLPDVCCFSLIILCLGGCFYAYYLVVNESKTLLLPLIVINTQLGLSPPIPGGTITAEMQDMFREQRLSIKNPNSFDLRGFSARVQLPERAVIGTPIPVDMQPTIPPSIRVYWQPENPKARFVHSESWKGSVTLTKGSIPSKSEWTLEIDSLPAFVPIDIPFLTIPEDAWIGGTTDTNSRRLINFLEGNFQYEGGNGWKTQTVFVPILYNSANRTITTLPPEVTGTNWDKSGRESFF